MDTKSSAHYQRLYRQRLREQGLVKKEVWILPEHAGQLLALERKLRQPRTGLVSPEMTEAMSMTPTWTAQTLCSALAGTELISSGQASLELIQGADASLHLTMHDYGDLPLFMGVYGEQIVVEAMLWPASAVTDSARFNDEVLRSHKLFPLSSIGLEQRADGQDYYSMFGALSSASTLSDVVFEIELLADNVIKATEAYEDYLKANI